MIREVTSLYIDDSAIRVLVANRKRIKKWAEVSLGITQARADVPVNETEVGERIKQLFKSEKIRSKKVIVGLSGLHCTIRLLSLPQLPRAMLEEAVTREAKRILPLPVEEVYISWQTVSTPSGKTNILFMAIPRQTVDTMVKVLRHAGIKPYLLEVKPLALAKMVMKETAVVVDIQATEFDITIISEGVPQLVRTVSLSDGTGTQKLQLLKDELSRTIQFYTANNLGSPPVSQIPVFVSGELADESKVKKALSTVFGSSPASLLSPLSGSEQFDPTRYMVNIGLALKDLKKRAGSLRVNLNALPIQYRPRPISLTRIIALPSATVIVALLLMLGVNVQAASEDIAMLQKEEGLASQLLVKRQTQKKEISASITDLQKRIAQIDQSREVLSTATDSLARLRTTLNTDLRTAWESTSGVSLSKITHDGSRMTIEGEAASEASVLEYTKKLQASARFSDVTVVSIRVSEKGIQFVLALKAGG